MEEDEILNKAYDKYENKKGKEETNHGFKTASQFLKEMEEEEAKIRIVFENGCSMKQKYETAGYFKHIAKSRLVHNNVVNGFEYNINDFNKVVLNGCKQQKRKRSVETQTDRKSPSIFDTKELYRL